MILSFASRLVRSLYDSLSLLSMMADYNKLAALVGTHQELALFRKYGALNAKNLLYMQAELTHLQSELARIELEDKYSEDPRKATYITSVFDLRDSDGTSRDLQWRKILEIREKLKVYSKFTGGSLVVIQANTS